MIEKGLALCAEGGALSTHKGGGIFRHRKACNSHHVKGRSAIPFVILKGENGKIAILFIGLSEIAGTYGGVLSLFWSGFLL